MVLLPKTALALAAFAACALHGAAFWFLHTPARVVRSAKVSLSYVSVKSQSATTIRSTQQPVRPATQPLVSKEEAQEVAQPPAKVEDETKVETLSPGDYIPSTLLDVSPTVVQDIPNEPAELLGRTETGTLILTLLIGAGGAVDDVVVESSDLPEVFAEVARRDFLGARFNPGMRNGQAVPFTIRIEVTIGSGQEP